MVAQSDRRFRLTSRPRQKAIMYVITVLFTVKPAHYDTFLQAVTDNARTSQADEPGCKQFDVCTSPSNPDDIFLYEVYDSKAAFDAHLASKHFDEFNTLTSAWVIAKVVNALERTHP